MKEQTKVEKRITLTVDEFKKLLGISNNYRFERMNADYGLFGVKEQQIDIEFWRWADEGE